jgi:Zn-finger nucleic acid-binding protein
MECPKCNGGSFLAEEELVKVIEGTEPHKIVIKAVHSCRACQERFSRLVWADLGPHRKHVPMAPTYQGQPSPNPYQYNQQPQAQPVKKDEEVVEGLKFF